MSNYRQFVVSVLDPALSTQEKKTLALLGITGELGEIVEQVKKNIFYSKPIDSEKLIEELGDMRYYIEVLCNEFNTTMSEIEAQNVRKLLKRYPNGFTKRDALLRRDKA